MWDRIRSFATSAEGAPFAVIGVIAAIAGIPLLALVVASAFDDEDEDEPTTAEVTPIPTLSEEDAEAVEQVVRDYFDATAEEDPEAICALESTDFRRSDCVENYTQILDELEGLEYQDLSIENIRLASPTAGTVPVGTVPGQAEGVLADVSYIRVANGEETTCTALEWALVEEDEEWKVDGREECPGGTGAPDDTGTATPEETPRDEE
jgi:hypothetical protein